MQSWIKAFIILAVGVPLVYVMFRPVASLNSEVLIRIWLYLPFILGCLYLIASQPDWRTHWRRTAIQIFALFVAAFILQSLIYLYLVLLPFIVLLVILFTGWWRASTMIRKAYEHPRLTEQFDHDSDRSAP